MKCHIMWHFIWIFYVCLGTHLGVSSIKGLIYNGMLLKVFKIIMVAEYGIYKEQTVQT